MKNDISLKEINSPIWRLVKQRSLQFCLFSVGILLTGALFAQNPTVGTTEYTEAKEAGLLAETIVSLDFDGNYPDVRPVIDGASERTGDCYIPHDPATWINFAGNDDGSIGPIALPFDFDLYGTAYTSVFINNNGNLTFLNGLSSFSSSGFPITTPMVAPFWGDVDTRFGRGEVWYLVTNNALYVNWVEVGAYNASNPNLENLRNTFQVIITDGSDPVLDPGNNIAFNYEVMDWTTGDASQGTNGFGGIPATVGVNAGDGVDFIQIGRFSSDTDDYDGPEGAEDGVNWLEDQCLQFNVSSETNFPPIAQNVPSGNEVTICNNESFNLDLGFIGPEGDQVVSVVIDSNDPFTINSNTAGNPAEVSITLEGLEPGPYTYEFTATDDGSPAASTTVSIVVIVEDCCQANPEISCPSDVVIDCDESTEPEFTGLPNVTIDDCYDGEVTISYSDEVEFVGNCTVITDRTW
ncbi:MAG: hypothetical protein P8L71_02355, partial [Flavobacteriales bacterium]|nr:hypothetical protein [Flavobacteriales bacterium]